MIKTKVLGVGSMTTTILISTEDHVPTPLITAPCGLVAGELEQVLEPHFQAKVKWSTRLFPVGNGYSLSSGTQCWSHLLGSGGFPSAWVFPEEQSLPVITGFQSLRQPSLPETPVLCPQAPLVTSVHVDSKYRIFKCRCEEDCAGSQCMKVTVLTHVWQTHWAPLPRHIWSGAGLEYECGSHMSKTAASATRQSCDLPISFESTCFLLPPVTVSFCCRKIQNKIATRNRGLMPLDQSSSSLSPVS